MHHDVNNFHALHQAGVCILLTYRFAVARAPPPIDASQDLTAASASRTDGVTTVIFN